jgi:hypothetical protein
VIFENREISNLNNQDLLYLEEYRFNDVLDDSNIHMMLLGVLVDSAQRICFMERMLYRMDHHHQLTDYQQDTGQQGE